MINLPLVDVVTVLVCCILSQSGVGLCDMVLLHWLERIVGWVHIKITSDCCFSRLWCS